MFLSAAAGAVNAMLQRGRAFWGAEIPHPMPCQWRSVCFNGAAPFGARRCVSQGKHRARLRASTGPRLLGRGDAAGTRLLCPLVSHASTGPRLLGRGDRSRSRCLSTRRDCFNGAAPFGARRSESKPHDTFIAALLQRGRAFWGAEMSGCEVSGDRLPVASTGPRLLGRGDERNALTR